MIKQKQIKPYLTTPYLALMAFILFFVATYIHFFAQSPPSNIETGNRSYLEGERSQTIESRKKAFNSALNAYLNLENEYDPVLGNGVLYYDIANTYFQLEEYPRAILYYYRALALRPFDENVFKNLNLALKKVDLPPVNSNTPFEKIFFFHTILSLPLRLQLFFITTLITFILASVYIWKPLSVLKKCCAIAGSLMTIMFVSLLITYFIETPQGIIVTSTNLYKGSSKQFAYVTEKPLKAGLKVSVTQSEEEGHWLKITTENGKIGYVPATSLVLIHSI